MSYIDEQVKRSQIMQSAIKKWGKDLQIEIAIEECAELIKALQKNKRINHIDTTVHLESIRNICDEIADVDIMIQQLKMIFPIQLIEEIKIIKLERLEKRIQSSTD